MNSTTQQNEDALELGIKLKPNLNKYNDYECTITITANGNTETHSGYCVFRSSPNYTGNAVHINDIPEIKNLDRIALHMHYDKPFFDKLHAYNHTDVKFELHMNKDKDNSREPMWFTGTISIELSLNSKIMINIRNIQLVTVGGYRKQYKQIKKSRYTKSKFTVKRKNKNVKSRKRNKTQK